MVSFDLTQVINGVSATDLTNSADAQYAFKVAISNIIPGLKPNEVTIISITARTRRLREVKDELELHGRKLGAGDSTTIVYNINTVAQNIAPSANPSSVAPSIASNINAAAASGVLSTQVAAAGAAQGTVILGDTVLLAASSGAVVMTAAASANPTGQPTGQPSGQPSSQPSMAPSGQPTNVPSGQPSTAPTNSAVDYFLNIDLDFNLMTELPADSVLIVSLPQIAQSTLQTTEPHVVERYSGMRIDWVCNWFGGNQTLELRTLIDQPPDLHSLTIGSVQLVLTDKIIYQDDSSISYTIKDPYGVVTNGGVFDQVNAQGLKYSSLSFGTSIRHSTSSLFISFTGEQDLLSNDRVNVFLPGFTSVDSNLATVPLLGSGNTSVIAKWSPALQAILFTLTQDVPAVTVEVPENVFILGKFGHANSTISPYESGLYDRLPSISVRTQNYKYFAPTPFQNFTPVAFMANSNITYDATVLAGQESDLHIDLDYSMGIVQGDAFFIHLPRFWTTSNPSTEISVISHYDGNFTAQWSACEEVLTLTRSTSDYTFLNTSEFNFVVSGMRLPYDGVTPELALHINVSSNASNGIIEPQMFRYTTTVGAFESSSLSFSASTLGSAVNVNVTFSTVSRIEIGDVISVVLPGVTIASSAPTSAQYEPYAATPTTMTAVFNVAWIAATYTMTFTATAATDRAVPVSMLVQAATLPSEGFPMSRTYLQENTYPTSDVTIALASSNGNINPTSFLELQKVGFETAVVHYEITDARKDIAVRFQFKISNDVASGDSIRFYSPFITAPGLNNVATSLTVYGDRGDNQFAESFTVTFDPRTNEFALLATATEVSREINLHLPESNGLRLNGTFESIINGTHWADMTIASMGSATKRVIEYTPNNVNAIVVPDAGVVFGGASACGYGTTCSLDFELTLTDDVALGEMFVLSHPNFFRKINFTEFTLKSDLMTVTGSAASVFSATWRERDNVDMLAVSSSAIAVDTSTGTSYLNTDTSIVSHTANYTLPTTAIVDSGAIYSNLPRVHSVYAEGELSSLMCGDTVILAVQFDEAVSVTDEKAQSLSLLLNTMEYAWYLDGNGTTVLRFLYNVQLSVAGWFNDVADLQVYGPGALEHKKPAYITRVDNSAVYANVTVPPPFGLLLRKNGVQESVSVGCQSSVVATNIDTFSEPQNEYYTTGDIIDVVVTFPRNIQTVGSPTLNLSTPDVAFNKYNQTYTFTHVNVSKIQWVDVSATNFSEAYKITLSYGGVNTDCLAWGDSISLYNALTALAPLKNSLPLTVQSFIIANGIRYKLTFAGPVAPGMLGVETLQCGSETAASVYYDSSSLNQAVFRYTVQENDTSYQVVSDEASLRFDDSNYIRVAQNTGSQTTVRKVSPILPFVGDSDGLMQLSKIGILANTPSISSVYASIFTNITEPFVNKPDAVSGDDVYIFVNFTSPVTLVGTVELELAFTSMVYGYNASIGLTRLVPLYAIQKDIMIFKYVVRTGDQVTALDYSSRHAITLGQDSMIYMDSLNPTTKANLVLPPTGSAEPKGLYANAIRVSATSQPVIDKITTNLAPGTYGVGQEIDVSFHFTAQVWVRRNESIPERSGDRAWNMTMEPNIRLHNPSTARMIYQEGNHSDVLTFKYTVQSGHNTAPHAMEFSNPNRTGAEWQLRLSSGEFVDQMNHRWNVVYSNESINMDSFNDVLIDTTTPLVVIGVESSTPDEVYHPGQRVTLTVLFTRPVAVIGANTPSLKIFVPQQVESNLLATYAGGNNTDRLHFSYLIPPHNVDHFRMPFERFMYAGTSALSEHLNGAVIYEYTTHPTTLVNTDLPVFIDSSLERNNSIYLNFNKPSILTVKADNADGVYTAGDMITIAVTFSQPVMMGSVAPVLRLDTGTEHRSAQYLSGNFSETLRFTYTVQVGDSSAKLEYVDTRISPYAGSQFRTYSLALNTDVVQSNTGRLVGDVNDNRHNDLVLMASAYGGLYRASSEGNHIQAISALPLPGADGSLSASSNIIIDTNSPQILQVYTETPTGTYGIGVSIDVLVRFDYAVTVSGCPKVLFQFDGVDSYAEYSSGSGSTILSFKYVVGGNVLNLISMAGSTTSTFDYKDTGALKIGSCTEAEADASFTNTGQSNFFIKRDSEAPSVDINSTLPWVSYVESVTAPTSISGGGRLLGLSADMAKPTAITVANEVMANSHFCLGDVINFNIEYNSAINAIDPDTLYLHLTGAADSLLDGSSSLRVDKPNRNVHYSTSLDAQTMQFALVVQANDSITGLSYAGPTALRSASPCSITDVSNGNACANQNLPELYATSEDSLDGLSLLSLVVSQSNPTITGLDFRADSVYFGASVTTVGDPLYGVPRLSATSTATEAFCEASGGSWFYREVVDVTARKRLIYSTRCPNHFNTCQGAACDGISSVAKPSQGYWELPLYPVMAVNLASNTNTTCWDSEVAIALNGASFFSQASDSASCEDAVQAAATSTSLSPSLDIDMCGGSADSKGVYNYRIPPSCLLTQLQESKVLHSPQVGWALDGFPVYGPLGPDGITMEPCENFVGTFGDSTWLSQQTTASMYCLDACNGLYAQIPNYDEYTYRYYVTGPVDTGDSVCSETQETCGGSCCTDRASLPASTFAPYTIGCFKGCTMRDDNCFLASNSTGTTDDFVPAAARGPSMRYTGNLNTRREQADANYGDTEQFLPSDIWDQVVSNTTEVTTPLTAETNPFQYSLSTGSRVYVAVTFSEKITVEGWPVLLLTHTDSASIETVVTCQYSHLSTDYTALFAVELTQDFSEGALKCAVSSQIKLNGGRILRSASFLPVLPADLSIGSLCCQDAACSVVANIQSGTPRVTRVYSPQEGILAPFEEIIAYVEFDKPVDVVGKPCLQLDLANQPCAEYVSKAELNVLTFRYTVRDVDATSSLDYYSPEALRFIGNNTVSQELDGLYDGILLMGAFSRVEADLRLPDRGTANSLSRQSNVILNNQRDTITSIAAVPSMATSGDLITFTLTYSAPMKIMREGASILDSSVLTADQITSNLAEQYLGLRIRIATSDLIYSTSVAYVSAVVGSTIQFQYLISNLDPSGTMHVDSITPFALKSGVTVITASTGASSPATVSRAQVEASLGTVDNVVPTIVNIFSPNVSTEYAFGPGDIIDIFVNITHAVNVITTPTLTLAIGSVVKLPVYVPYSGAISTLHFRYSVVEGDSATPLEYTNSSALGGLLMRYSSSSATLPADLTLAEPFSSGSLGFCCNVQVDTSAPYIKSLVPLKRTGTYGRNERIVIIAKFNKPVEVSGTPQLLISTIDYLKLGLSAKPTYDSSVNQLVHEANGIGFASYIPHTSFTEYDAVVDLDARDMLFEYYVKEQDDISALEHHDANSLILPHGATVRHYTSNPYANASLALRDPLDHVLLNGEVRGQWKAKYAAKVELLIRDLYHSAPDSLSIRLEHGGRGAKVMEHSAKLRGKTFGRSYPGSFSGVNNTKTGAMVDAGIGYPYFFSDTRVPNIAALGSTTQSGTQSESRRAIDGQTDPLLGHSSVSESIVQANAWWQLQLPEGSMASSVSVWPRRPQMWVEPIVSVTVKALDTTPDGTFIIKLADISIADPVLSISTAALPFGTDAATLKAEIQALNVVGIVTVERDTLQVCDPFGVGCNAGLEFGFGHTYRITFLDVLTSSPTLSVTNVTFQGGPVDGANGFGASNEVSNVLTYDMDNRVDVLRIGEYIEAQASDSGNGQNEWLTPFHVMFFDELPPTDLTAALSAASFSINITSIDKVARIDLPSPRSLLYVKVQREGYGSISLAEVEVFGERLNTLTEYNAGSPIASSTPMEPYQAEESFAHAFEHVKFDGRWIVQIEQSADYEPPKTHKGFSFAHGTISDVVIVVTDLAGVMHTYYQDIKAELLTLPKYGEVFSTTATTSSPYGLHPEGFELSELAPIESKEGGSTITGICYGTATSDTNGVAVGDGFRYCVDQFGMGTILNRVNGDSSEYQFIRNEKVIIYKPIAGFTGPDFFTYQMYDGLSVQKHIAGNTYMGQETSTNEVSIHVRNCRRYTSDKRYGNAEVDFAFGVHSLCSCASTETMVVGNRTLGCDAARTSICLSTNAENISSGGRSRFLNMCLACETTATSGLSGFQSAECIFETERAVGFLVSRSLCSAEPSMDCSTELITTTGQDRWEYLSLMPPHTDEAFTALGNSVGGYGYYRSSTMN